MPNDPELRRQRMDATEYRTAITHVRTGGKNGIQSYFIIIASHCRNCVSNQRDLHCMFSSLLNLKYIKSPNY